MWIVRIPAFLVAVSPVVFGYFLSTVGILALMFIEHDLSGPPTEVERMRPCQESPWGAAFTASGYTMKLYRSWNGLPGAQGTLG